MADINWPTRLYWLEDGGLMIARAGTEDAIAEAVRGTGVAFREFIPAPKVSDRLTAEDSTEERGGG